MRNQRTAILWQDFGTALLINFAIVGLFVACLFLAARFFGWAPLGDMGQ
jgi:hypothetical protein